MNLLNDMKNTWIDSSVWPSHTWCVFGRSIRTNNDVERWYNRINVKAREEKLLYDEAEIVNLQVRLLS